MNPNETIVCSAIAKTQKSIESTASVRYEAYFDARTDLPIESETYKNIGQRYSRTYLDRRMTKSVRFSGELFR